jgi:hypothetical protein
VLQKPFDVSQLIESVQEALGGDAWLSQSAEDYNPAETVSLLDAAKALRTCASAASWPPSGTVHEASPPSGLRSTGTRV